MATMHYGGKKIPVSFPQRQNGQNSEPFMKAVMKAQSQVAFYVCQLVIKSSSFGRLKEKLSKKLLSLMAYCDLTNDQRLMEKKCDDNSMKRTSHEGSLSPNFVSIFETFY